MHVLVGFASAHGSTRELAERLAARLSEAGLKAQARAMETVDDADAYGASVLGSAVHGQTWLDPAKDFVRDNLDLLGTRPVWLFSVGMPGALRGPWKRLVPREAPAIVDSLPGDLSAAGHMATDPFSSGRTCGDRPAAVAATHGPTAGVRAGAAGGL